LSYPFPILYGVGVSDWLSPTRRVVLRIKNNKNIIRDVVKEYRFTDLTLKTRDRKRFFGEILRRDIKRRKWTLEGLLELDFIDSYFIVLSELDWIFHSYYDAIIQGHIPRHVRASLSALSDTVDSIIRIARKRGMDIFIVSDHGFRVYNKMICVNDLLRKMGYAQGISIRRVSKASKRCSLKSIRDEKRTLKQIMLHHFLAIAYFLNIPSAFSDRVYKYIIRSNYRILVDNKKSKAFTLMNIPAFFIAVNKHLEGREKEKTIMGILYKLKSLHDKHRRPLFSLVARREDIYSGPFTDLAPHICVYGNIDAGYLTSAILTGSPIIQKKMNYHDFDAIFIMWRKDIEQKNLGIISIYDVAPTIMAVKGIPIQKGMDGSPLIGDGVKKHDYMRSWMISRRIYKKHRNSNYF